MIRVIRTEFCAFSKKYTHHKGVFTMNVLKLSAVISLFTLVLSGCASTHGTSPKGLETPIEKAAIKFASDVKEGGYKVVTTEELKKWIDEKKNITILSSLPADEDKAFGTLPGALNAAMPKTEKDFTPENKERLLKVAGDDKERTLVIYCGFVACRRSHIGAKLLVDNGFKNVYRYPAGITGWGEAGYQLVK
jgi:thiosulfate/3-mercaptopyruvate sulfurtransferase